MASWLLFSWGIYPPDLVGTKGIILMLGILWLVLLLSKILFKKSFTNGCWETLFLFMAGFPTLVQLFYGNLYYVNALTAMTPYYTQIEVDFFFPYFNDLLFLPLPVFFMAYLIHFIIRLARFLFHRGAEAVRRPLS